MNIKKTRIISNKLEEIKITINNAAGISKRISVAEAMNFCKKLSANKNHLEAIAILDRIAEKASLNLEQKLMKLGALIEIEDVAEAKPLVSSLLKYHQHNTLVLQYASKLALILGKSELALKYLNQARTIDPDDITIMLALAESYSMTAQKDKALEIYRSVYDIARTRRNNFKNLITGYELTAIRGILRFEKRIQQEDVKRMDVTLNSEEASWQLKAQIAFTLASNAKKNSNIELEMDYLQKANDYSRKESGYSINADKLWQKKQRKYNETKKLFYSANPDWSKSITPDTSKVPICILAAPRSGTTLLQQLLSAHSNIGEVGESQAFSLAISKVYQDYFPALSIKDFPKFFDRLPKTAFDRIIKLVNKHQNLLTNQSLYVDKSLNQHRHAGLIALLYSNARFIHIDRSPLDIILSCYIRNIPGIPATSVVENMAINYLSMKRNVSYWKKIHPDRIYSLSYANLVSDTEKEAQKLSKFIGIEWEPSVLEFYNRKNIVRTHSTDQVRKNIYTSSINNWKGYEKALEPAIKLLESHGIHALEAT